MESLDRLFEIFSRERRRYALYGLAEADEPLTLEELAEQVRRWEADDDGVDAGAFDDVAISLAHTHLPKAAAAEYIEYDRERGEIRITGEPAEFRIVLAVGEALERPGAGQPFDPDEMTAAEFFSRFATSG